MIASGESVLDICIQLKEQGAKRIYAAVSFSLFTEGPAKFDDFYERGLLNAVYSTNLTYVPDEVKNRPWFKQVNMSKLLAKFIYNINIDISLSGLLAKTRGIKSIVKD